MTKLEEVRAIMHDHKMGNVWYGERKGSFDAWFRWHADEDSQKKLKDIGCEVELTSSLSTPLTRILYAGV